jgi:F0F1-type ATP synthase membrane subunit a
MMGPFPENNYMILNFPVLVSFLSKFISLALEILKGKNYEGLYF